MYLDMEGLGLKFVVFEDVPPFPPFHSSFARLLALTLDTVPLLLAGTWMAPSYVIDAVAGVLVVPPGMLGIAQVM